MDSMWEEGFEHMEEFVDRSLINLGIETNGMFEILFDLNIA